MIFSGHKLRLVLCSMKHSGFSSLSYTHPGCRLWERGWARPEMEQGWESGACGLLSWEEAQCSLRGHARLRYALKVWPEPKQQDEASKVSPIVAIILIPDFWNRQAPSCLQHLCLCSWKGKGSSALGNKLLLETSGFTWCLMRMDNGVSHNAPLLPEFLWAPTQIIFILINVVNQALAFKGIWGNLPAKSWVNPCDTQEHGPSSCLG